MSLSGDPKWQALRAEHTAARAELSGVLGAVDARMRDPFRLRAAIERHPILTAGLAAGAGALLVNLLMPHGGGGDGDSRPDDAGSVHRDAADARSPVADALRDHVVRLAIPWITDLLAQMIEAAPPAGDAAAPADPAAPS